LEKNLPAKVHVTLHIENECYLSSRDDALRRGEEDSRQAPADQLDLQRAIMDVMNLALRADKELAEAQEKITRLEREMDVEKNLRLIF